MDSYERNNRIEEALNMRGMKAVELAEKSGLSQTSISHWIKQRWQPKATPLHKMAKVLGVTELWLAGYPVPMERPAEQVRGDKIADIVKELRDNDRLINIVSQLPLLTDSQLDSIETMVNEFAKLNPKN